MEYTWKCGSCAMSAVHASESANHYRVGFEIYTTHQQGSPNCKTPDLQITEGDAETLIQSESFQHQMKRVKSLGGYVDVDENRVTLYKGIIPTSTTEVFAALFRRMDSNRLLIVNVSAINRP